MTIRPWTDTLELYRGKGEWPAGILIFYGPDNRHASMVIATVLAHEDALPVMHEWYESEMDVRLDGRIGGEVERFFREHPVHRIVMRKGVYGCPHDEGVDYPEGGVCPHCPFWATHHPDEETYL